MNKLQRDNPRIEDTPFIKPEEEEEIDNEEINKSKKQRKKG
jgi:hypothetical protein